jgi:hypothetical protein
VSFRGDIRQYLMDFWYIIELLVVIGLRVVLSIYALLYILEMVEVIIHKDNPYAQCISE